jgi:hypothetical protein
MPLGLPPILRDKHYDSPSTFTHLRDDLRVSI